MDRHTHPAYRFDDHGLRLLDQRLLPTEEHWVAVRDVDHMIELIQGLAVRGAPLIGVSAALALAQHARAHAGDVGAIRDGAQRLAQARPTAVNLGAMIRRMLRENPSLEAEGLWASALRIAAEDEAMCTAIGLHGAPLLADGDGVLTICNTGSLATAGIGTALGVILTAHRAGRRLQVYACETRPLLQGARLTAWELRQAGVPYTLICDSAASALMVQGKIQCVLAGADRIAANGDSANKIGTYALAVAAHHHRIPFYIVAPTSTIDRACPDGAAIPIEERSAEEVRGVRGAFGAVTWAPGTPVHNPAFDVTPHALIRGIVLETGIWTPATGAVAAPTPTAAGPTPATTAAAAPAHPVHDATSLQRLLAGLPRARAMLGGRPEAWQAREFGDGNVNLLFQVQGPAGSLIVKQAVPYLRCVGAAWPLSIERVRFEFLALQEYQRLVPGSVPEPLAYDPATASLVMEYLQPHRVLRLGLLEGQRYPHLASHLARILARMLLGTSDLQCDAAHKRRLQTQFLGNGDLCRITEDLIFTDPYRDSRHNRWTSPQLDDIALRLRADREAKVAIIELKRRFLGHAEALIHGDLHTGSIMVTPEDTRIIDPEFACYGPAGFDCGLLLGNLLMAALSQPGHAAWDGERADHQQWVFQVVETLWEEFAACFHAGYRAPAESARIAPDLFDALTGRSALPQLAGEELERIFADSLGFAGAEMIRRILGLAHVAEFERIADPEVRARCERQALVLARDLLVHRHHYRTIGEVTARARLLAAAPRTEVSHG